MYLLLVFITTAAFIGPSFQSSGDFDQIGCTCPNECICSETAIVCTGKNISIFPDELKICSWDKVQTLNISGTLIERINFDDLVTFPSLTKLFLYNNLISYIDPRAFNGLVSLTLLSLDGNNIKVLHVNSFKNLTSLRTLLLYSNKLTELAPGIFDDLHNLNVLSIHANRLTHLNESLFTRLTNLQRLYCQGNLVSNISNGPFRSLSKLTLLYLSGNKIDSLTETCLTGLTSLRTLVLRSNSIANIDTLAFINTRYLQSMYLDYNRIEIISESVLSPLSSLQILTLSGNRIHTIEDGAFSNSYYIHTLYLQGNRLQNLTVDTFRGLLSLQELNEISDLQENLFIQSQYMKRLWLQYNKINCINKNAFRGLKNLELIHLAENNISYLPNDVFQSNLKLLYIILSSNKLREITTRPFRNLPNLVQLALFDNAITSIADGSFENTNRLTYIQWNQQLDFTKDNRLTCDCNALWLQNYIKVHRPYYASVYCGGPHEIVGQPLLQVSIKDRYNCSDSNKLTIKPASPVVYAQEGGCLELECKASKTSNVTWSKLGGRLRVRQAESQRCTNTPADLCGNTDTLGLLTIPSVTSDDEGIYTCSVTYNNLTISKTRTVAIGEPPVINTFPQDVILREPPAFIIFEASASGSPSPTMKWFHGPIEIDFSSRNVNKKYFLTVTGSLIIINPGRHDNGLYRFEADNGAGIARASASLTIYFDSPCYRGQGCGTNGTCVPYYYCVCDTGYSGEGCEIEDSTTPPPTSPPDDQYDYSGYYSGDQYYSGDYNYERKRRSFDVQYDYDFIDVSMQKQKKSKVNTKRFSKFRRPASKSVDPVKILKSLPHPIDVSIDQSKYDIVPLVNMTELKS